jgi:Phage integrase, N-terminal SAM-like domain
MIDIVFEHPDGRHERVRKISPLQTRRGAEQYERDIRSALLDGSHGRKEEASEPEPTLAQFQEKFVEVYATTENKQSEIIAKKGILRNYLVPFFGKMPLSAIYSERIAEFKAQQLKAGFSSKTVNNQLAVLRRLLAVAVEWGKLSHVPPLKWLRVPPPPFDFLGASARRAPRAPLAGR